MNLESTQSDHACLRLQIFYSNAWLMYEYKENDKYGIKLSKHRKIVDVGLLAVYLTPFHHSTYQSHVWNRHFSVATK